LLRISNTFFNPKPGFKNPYTFPNKDPKPCHKMSINIPLDRLNIRENEYLLP
jgi:hypothetical protein